jgi:hypothetical protein
MVDSKADREATIEEDSREFDAWYPREYENIVNTPIWREINFPL